MAVICSQCGTLSESVHFCDDCGARVEAHAVEAATLPLLGDEHVPTASSPSGPSATHRQAEWSPEMRTCPERQGGCGAVRQTLGPFCKLCGFNFRLLQPGTLDITGVAMPQVNGVSSAPRTPSAPSTKGTRVSSTVVPLKAIISCDRQLYESLHDRDRQELAFPEHEPAVTVALTAAEMLIGRASSQNPVQPHIVIGTDPGVSRQHARLLQQEDGSYAILDTGSAGGTVLNGHPIQGKLTPLKPGDVLVLGAWTRIDILAQ